MKHHSSGFAWGRGDTAWFIFTQSCWFLKLNLLSSQSPLKQTNKLLCQVLQFYWRDPFYTKLVGDIKWDPSITSCFEDQCPSKSVGDFKAASKKTVSLWKVASSSIKTKAYDGTNPFTHKRDLKQTELMTLMTRTVGASLTSPFIIFLL